MAEGDYKNTLSSDFVCWVRGLPYSVNEDEIAEFFNGCRLAGSVENSITITYNRSGRPSGECFVLFADQASFNSALAMHKQSLGKRYIEVFQSDMQDYRQASRKSDSFRTRVQSQIVRIRGIPFGTSDDAIRDFFAGCSIENLHVPRMPNGQCKGHGFVVFSSTDDVKRAMARHMQPLDRRYIEVFQSNQMELDNELNGVGFDSSFSRRRKRLRSDSPGRDYHKHRNVNAHNVSMRGIPFRASEGDIIKFFNPTLPRMVTIHMEGGRPSGQATVEFNTHDEALQAMEKDRQYMGQRYVELFLESSEDVGADRPVPFRIPGRRKLMEEGRHGNHHSHHSSSSRTSYQSTTSGYHGDYPYMQGYYSTPAPGGGSGSAYQYPDSGRGSFPVQDYGSVAHGHQSSYVNPVKSYPDAGGYTAGYYDYYSQSHGGHYS